MLSRRIKLHIKAPLHTFKAGAHIGFEQTLAKELSLLGINECEIQDGAIYFKAKFEKVWQLIVLSRCARNFEMQITEFHCENFGKLEHEIKNIPWELYLPQTGELKIDVKTEKSRLYHKKAIEERFKINFGGKLNVKFKDDVCSIWIDLCGEPLYKRGERWVEEAPLQETLAANILLYADFAKYEKLIDPMAGSGVFSLEAIKWRSNLKMKRDFDFMKMPAFREAAFNNFLQKAKQPFATDGKYEILCSDINPKAVKTIMHNAVGADLRVCPYRADFFSLPPAENALLVLNPPYGKRLGKEKNLYKEIAKKIEKDFSKCKTAILCPPWEKAWPDCLSLQTYNGGLKIMIKFI